MAGAIIRGAIASGRIAADRFVIVEPDEAKRREFDSIGTQSFAELQEAATAFASIEPTPGDGHLVLAVKPQGFPQIAAGARAALVSRSRRVASIMAGTTTSMIEASLGPNARVIRLMPNTPAQIGKSTTAWSRGISARPGDEGLVVALFGTIGVTIELEERLLDAFTAVAGSGPAYLFYLAEAMMSGAIREGVEPRHASDIVRSVLVGASALLAATPNRSPAELRKSVTSRGGTTEAAVRVLDEAQVREAIERAIAEATARGKSLSG